MHTARRLRGVWPLLLAVACAGSACIIEDDKDDDSDESTDSPIGEKDGGTPGPDGGTTPADGGTSPGVCTKPVDDSTCDKTKRPIVFVHGTLANGESFGHPALLFASNGYCPDRIRAIEYHSIPFTTCPTSDAGTTAPVGMDGGVAPAADGGVAGDAGCVPTLDREAAYKQVKQEVDAVIAKLLKETGADKVDLAGHSQGAGHGAKYAGENPATVAHYLSLAGGDLAVDPGGVPTLCLSSTGDRPAKCGTTSNVVFDDLTLDHSAVSSSTEAFVEMYKFLNDGKEPKFKEVQCSDKVLLEGRGLSFGDNKPLPGAKLEVYALTNNAWFHDKPLKVFDLAADGSFGPWEAQRGVAYEFKMVPPPGDKRRPRRAYFPPFQRSDRLLRFNFESSDPRAAATGAKVNYDDSHAVLIARRRQKAFMHPRDSLKIDGFEVVSAQNTLTATGRSTVTCALYLFDKVTSTTSVTGPGDGNSTGESIIKSTFVDSADIFMQSAKPQYLKVVFNGQQLLVPNWPSAKEGASLVLLD